MPRSTITLTSDFGLKDSYVAEMKAVILSINPEATIVDITHEIKKFDVRMGAFVLASAVPYFPKGAVHVAVVDPGVGTRRRALLVQTPQDFLIGPDNGILALAARRQGVKSVHEITNRKFMLPSISSTFHGRDLFAPAAAHLTNGTPPAKLGPRIRKIVSPQFSKIVKKKDSLVGEVIHVDGFGNIVTNIGKTDFEPLDIKSMVKIWLGTTELRLKFCKTYAEAGIRDPLAIVGSHDFLEIALNRGNAAKRFKTKIGDTVTLCHS
jgi:S-adenosylmethionine hydrolase